MWLPTPIYERVPQFYVLAGLLFITDGVYLGFDYTATFFYLAVGVACLAYGVGLFVVRLKLRKAPSADEKSAGADADSAESAEGSAAPSEALAPEISSQQSVQH